MSFDISDSSRITKDKKVLCDYYDCSIYLSQYERTPNNGGYIKIPYFTPENIVKPNAILMSGEPTVNYMSNKLYIFKKTHNINGVKYDGELIIENKRITNGTNKIYTCFPLITSKNTSANQLDKLIDNSEQLITDELKMTVNLNKIFNKLQKYIFYKNGDDIVVVFTEPIKVANSFDRYIPCELFSSYNENYNILQNVSGNEGFQNFTEEFVEGARNKKISVKPTVAQRVVPRVAPMGTPIGASTIASNISSGEMDCYPIDVKGNSLIQDTAIVGLNSGTDSQNKTINILFAMIMFLIIFFIAIFGAPSTYKYIFVDKLEDTTLTYTVMFLIFYLLWALLMAMGGLFITKDTSLGVAGIFFLILSVISSVSIYFMRGTLDIDGYELGFDLKMFLNDGFNFFISYLNDLYTNQISSKYIYGAIIGTISVFVTIILFPLVTKYTGAKNKQKYRKNLLGKKVPDRTDPRFKAYRDYVYAMLSIFGFGYGIFLVAPFVGYITSS